MKRNAMNNLKAWIDSAEFSTVLLTGSRGTGKTYLSLEFAKSFFNEHIYINFQTDARLRDYVKTSYYCMNENRSLIELICSYLEIEASLYSNVLFIFDEIGYCTEAIELLYRFTSLPLSNIKVFSISSLYNKRFDSINNVFRVNLKPLSFDEFLIASGHEWYREVIQAHYMTMKRIPNIVHQELLSIFYDYLQIGGMPSVVNDFLTMDSDVNTLDTQINIYNNIISEINLNYPEGEYIKQTQILDIIDSQILKNNKKFQYILIRKGATYNLYKDALDELINSFKVIRCPKININSISNSFDIDDLSFRLYYADLSLLNMKIKCYAKNINVPSALIKKAYIDTYAAEELSVKSEVISYWESNSQAKVDFIVKNRDGLIPIDIKIDTEKKSKSLTVYIQQFSTPYGIRLTDKNFELTSNIKNIPYYSTFCI